MLNWRASINKVIVLITLTNGFFSEIDVRMFGKTSGHKWSFMSPYVDFVASEILLDFFTLCQIFCPRNKCENKFSLNIYSSLLQTSMFWYFYIKEVTEKFQTEQFLVDAILHFQVRSESDTRRLSTLVVASFSERT